MVEYKDRPPTPLADSELFGYSARYRLYKSADEWIYLAAPYADEWPALCDAMMSEVDLAADARFDNEASRVENDDTLAEELSAVFARKPGQFWEDLLLSRDVGCVVAHREPPETVLQSDAFAGAADMLLEVEHPTFGQHVRLKPYVAFSRSQTVAEPASLAGQHTDLILSELGYSRDAVEDLRTRKVVA